MTVFHIHEFQITTSNAPSGMTINRPIPHREIITVSTVSWTTNFKLLINRQGKVYDALPVRHSGHYRTPCCVWTRKTGYKISMNTMKIPTMPAQTATGLIEDLLMDMVRKLHKQVCEMTTTFNIRSGSAFTETFTPGTWRHSFYRRLQSVREMGNQLLDALN